MIQLPEEMLNQIFSYCQSPTNQIMKENIKHITSINKTKADYLNNIFCILEMNKEYGFIHYNHERFMNRYSCANCNVYLTSKERMKPLVVYGNIICYECVDIYPF
jgi:hypothetical protein